MADILSTSFLWCSCAYALASTKVCSHLHAYPTPLVITCIILDHDFTQQGLHKAEVKNSLQVYSLKKHSLCKCCEVVMTEPVPAWESAVFVFECVVPPSAVICILIECELCLSCIILNIVCRMDIIDSAAALNIKRAQQRHIRIIHSGTEARRIIKWI